MTAETRYEVNLPDVVDESVDGEALIVHLGTGAYYSARGTGDAVWQLLSKGSTADEVARAFGVDAGGRDEISRFLARLVEEDLVRPSAAASAGEAPKLTLPFEPPVLEKYTDMQELLLLDPIHDVDDEEGWPNVRAGAAEGEA